MVEISMFSTIIIAVGVAVFVTVMAVFLFLKNFALSKQVRYETGLEDLHDQLKQGLISESTYKQLRFDLEQLYKPKWYEQHDMGRR